MPAMAPPVRGSWLRAAAALLISIALVAVVVAQLELGQLPQRLAAVHPAWWLVISGWSLLVLTLRSLRFWLLTPGNAPAVVVGAVALQNLLNRVTPFRLGELALPYYVARHGGEPGTRALLLLVQIRLLELCTMLAIALWSALRALPRAQVHGLWSGLFGLALLGVLLVGFPRWIRLGLGLARNLLQSTSSRRLEALARAVHKLEAASAVGATLSARQWLALVTTTLAVIGANYALCGSVLRAFGVHLPWHAVVLGASVGQVGSVVPVTTVGSFGTLEAAWIAGFMAVGVSLADAALTAVATQLYTLGMAALFALPSYLYFRRLDARRRAEVGSSARELTQAR